MSWCPRALCALALIGVLSPGAARAQDPVVGPRRGALVVAGGAVRDVAIFQRFIELAGGGDAPIVVIPTASGETEFGPGWPGLRPLRDAGARNLSVLHTGDRAVADSQEFVAPIRAASGVWFSGGRQWRLADSYLETLTHRELFALLERGGVVGGTSAGATIQGSYLARGDTGTNTIMMGDHEVGLGFLKNVAIDQHLLRRNRHFDLLAVIEAHPELLGLGLDEDTALVVQGDRSEVIGRSYVAVYDNRRSIDTGGRFFFLAPGDRYDLGKREATRDTLEPEPLERVVEEPWRSGSEAR